MVNLSMGAGPPPGWFSLFLFIVIEVFLRFKDDSWVPNMVTPPKHLPINLKCPTWLGVFMNHEVMQLLREVQCYLCWYLELATVQDMGRNYWISGGPKREELTSCSDSIMFQSFRDHYNDPSNMENWLSWTDSQTNMSTIPCGTRGTIHEDSRGQEEIWAKLMALDAYCDSLLLDAETSVVKWSQMASFPELQSLPGCFFFMLFLYFLVGRLIINYHIQYYHSYKALIIYLFTYVIHTLCTAWFSVCSWEWLWHISSIMTWLCIEPSRSNWQPPWEEGAAAEPMSLERLRQEDESTVYDWVGASIVLDPWRGSKLVLYRSMLIYEFRCF